MTIAVVGVLNQCQCHENMVCVSCSIMFDVILKGLENSWERHEKVAEYFHAGLENMGLKLFVKEKVSF